MKALVLSGGGSRGAFQVGVVKSLFQQGFRPSIVTGVSVGAFNSFFIAQHKISELERLWLQIKSNDDVYRKRLLAAPFMLLGWQWGFPSLYKPGPLSKLLKHKIKSTKQQEYFAELRVGAVDLISGLYTSVNQTSPMLEKFIAASMAVPMAFPPVKIKHKQAGGVYVDGCIRNLTPLGEAIRAGATEIHIILADQSDMQPKKVSYRKYEDIVARTIDIALHEILLRDIDNVLVRNELAQIKPEGKYKSIKLTLYEPTGVALPGLLDFNPESIKTSIAAGEEIGLQGVTTDVLIEKAVKNKGHRFVG